MKVVGMMIVGPGEADRWLDETLTDRTRLVDDMVIATCNATQKEKKLIKKYGFWQYEDNREWGYYQPNIKTDLLARVAKLNPDGVLPSDADEIYDREFTKEAAYGLVGDNILGAQFYIFNLWNDANHFHKGLSFHNLRFFRLDKRLPMYFSKKNVHCGWAPEVYYNKTTYVPYLVKHYGIMKPEDRTKKLERYSKYDPKGRNMPLFGLNEYYEKLKDTSKGAPFNEEEIKNKINADWQKHYAQNRQG